MAKRNNNSAAKILKQLGENAVKAARAALAKSADEVVAEAKSRVSVKTGALRDSIQAEKIGNGKFKITANAKSDDERNFAYGRIVEYSPKINKPFLHSALLAKRGEVQKNIVDAVREAIRKK